MNIKKSGSRSDPSSSIVFFITLLTLSLCIHASARANTGRIKSSSSSIIEEGSVGSASRSFYLSAALSGGPTNNSGSQVEALLMSSYHFTSFILEGGLGFQRTSSSGGSDGSAANSSLGSNFSLVNYEQTTQNLVAEFSPQYRLTENLQIGPLAEMLFGTDVSMVPGLSSEGQTTAFMAGGQALYGFSIDSVYLRVGARYLSSLNLESDQIQSIQATLQIGLPLF